MPNYEAFDWYEHPLYYDIVFDTGTQSESAFLQAVHDRHVKSRGRAMLEPACGSGRLLAAMAARNFKVTGFDVSTAMLDFARERLQIECLPAKLVDAAMETFKLNSKFDIAHCLVSTFKYIGSESTARSHLRRIANSLKVGGVYVLGLHLTDYTEEQRTRERWASSRGSIQVVCNIQCWPANKHKRTEKIRTRLVVSCLGTQRHFETHWTFRTYSLKQLRTLINSEPALEHVATYDFTHDIKKQIQFDGKQLDTVLILRRR